MTLGGCSLFWLQLEGVHTDTTHIHTAHVSYQGFSFLGQEQQVSSEVVEPISRQLMAHHGMRRVSKDTQWGIGRVNKEGGVRHSGCAP